MPGTKRGHQRAKPWKAQSDESMLGFLHWSIIAVKQAVRQAAEREREVWKHSLWRMGF